MVRPPRPQPSVAARASDDNPVSTSRRLRSGGLTIREIRCLRERGSPCRSLFAPDPRAERTGPDFLAEVVHIFPNPFYQATKVTQPSCARLDRQHPTVGHDPTIVPMSDTGLNCLGRTGEALHRYVEGIIDGS